VALPVYVYQWYQFDRVKMANFISSSTENESAQNPMLRQFWQTM
jgi:hypothetical protein